jgi:hypothetical protein
LAVFAAIALCVQSASTQSASLKIVVVDGEDAVNIIQQKTAVAPVIEVRDRNDQPVAGAIVNFAIRGGRATFGGARTLAVTTDVAGRAVAASLTPTASGAVQISATAAFQGQTAAAVTITQTNVMTAAQAAAVSSAAGSSSGAASGTGAGAGGGSGSGATAGAGAGAGSGGGLSATTIGIIGGAVAGGAIVATQAIGSSGASFVGPFSGQMREVFGGCTRGHAASGEVMIELDDPAAGSLGGSGQVEGTFVGNGSTCPNDPFATRTQQFGDSSNVSGSPGALTFRIDHSNPVSDPPGATYRNSFTFTGALSGSEITGTLTFEGATTLAGGGITGVIREAYPVTLRKQ